MTGRALAAWVRQVSRARGLWLLVTLGLMGVGVFGGSRIRFEDDARSMIAGADPEIALQLQTLSELTAIEHMLLHVDGSDIHGPELNPHQASEGAPTENAEPGGRPALGERLLTAGQVVVAALEESGQFEEVRYSVSPAQQLELAEVLMPQRFLLDGRDPEELFADEHLRQALLETREALLAPTGIVQKAFLLRDPFRSLAAALTPLAETPGLQKLDTQSGRFFSADGTGLLIIATPKGDPFAGEDAARTMRAIEGAQAALQELEPQMHLRAIGAHRYQRDAETLIKRDVHLSAALTAVIVIAIFITFFRRLRLALIALPPLAFGACVAAGLAGLWGRPIHGIVLAFSAACLGLSIDYTIHLLAAVDMSPKGTSSTPAAERLADAVQRVGGSLTLAVTSTIAGLCVLALSSVDALEQMAVLASGAVGGAFLGNLLWVPILTPLLLGQSTSSSTHILHGPWSSAVRLGLWRPRLTLIIALTTAVIFAMLAMNIRIDGDLRNLDTHTPLAQSDEAAFARAFGDPTTTALAIAAGPDLSSALEHAQRITEQLTSAGITRVLSPVHVAPSPSVGASRRDAWCRDRDARVQRLHEAAAQWGFVADAFAPFEADLEHLCTQALPAPARPLKALGEILGRDLIRPSAEGVRLPIVFESDQKSLAGLSQSAEDVPVMHHVVINQRMVEVIARELPRLGGFALTLVALILLVGFGNLHQPLLALAPCLWGILATVGIMGALDLPINLMNLCLFPLLCGLGIDYGILMTDVDNALAHSPDHASIFAERSFSVAVAAVTTCAGFGTLAIARYAAIATIGRAVLLAVIACALASFFIPPAILTWQKRRA